LLAACTESGETLDDCDAMFEIRSLEEESESRATDTSSYDENLESHGGLLVEIEGGMVGINDQGRL